ncbi:hydroxyacyl-coenzyme A dehydrogenase, mitochondrial-like [Macrosteles quadrilineatus]|uniref:hydroxyacyl-coenzyme A dehydrogenase, mitochondrial-like n=1 Tax=Macrosteles quadrilineatus TaxID=74068 RepID=UPI0023E24872|nr:hydroxyacyl-coenzyme A dehydrogenase, mitochondrial-like [Macrosteles quadrilineatus]
MSLPFSVFVRGFSKSTSVSASINHVTVIGGGLMGSGIAQVAAQAGNKVTLVEVNDSALQNATKRIEDSLKRVAKKVYKEKPADGETFLNETKSRINYSTDLTGSVKQTDLVLEAIVEKMTVKHELFSKIDPVAPQSAIFASNTSSLSITEIGSVTKRKDKFAGLHFFNPVPVMKLLEVIRTVETSDETFTKLMEWGKAIGKVTITCKDTPGFVVNRLLVPLMAEAVRMMERGDASAKDIDIAMKLGAGHPMGPFELADYVGHDTTNSILTGWYEKFPDNPLFEPLKSMQELVKQGKLGVKSGEGYYKYEKK